MSLKKIQLLKMSLIEFTNREKLNINWTLHPFNLEKNDIKLLKNLKYLKTIDIELDSIDSKQWLIDNICTITNVEKLYIMTKLEKTCSSTPSTSTNGKCGNENGKYPSGQWCNKYSWCGTSEKYCCTGYQSEFSQ